MGQSQKDGLGIAYVGSDGNIHRRRWASSDDFKGLITDDLRGPFCEITSEPPIPANIPATGFVLLHGRTATCDKGLANSHPHIIIGPSGTEYALIHNGQVQASDKDKKELGDLLSSCDSELILAAFASGGMEKVSNIITGYYAFGIIVKNTIGEKFLHVVKDDRAQLHVGEIPDKTYVFATTPELLGIAGVKVSARVQSLTHLIFSGDGELFDMNTIPKPKAYVYSYQPTYCSSSTKGYTYEKEPAPTRGNQSTLQLALPAPSTPRVKESDEFRYESYWERYCAEHGLDPCGDPLTPEARAAMAHGSTEFVQGESNDPPPDPGPREYNPVTSTEYNLELAEIDAKLEKAYGRIKRLTDIKYKKIKIDSDNNRIIAQNAQASGTSDTHSVPISDDESMAATAAMIEAERDAAGLNV
jgi:hypothetical protein